MHPQAWKIWNQAPNATAIASGIKDIPAHWSLTPLQDKAPKRDGWEQESFIPHHQIAALIIDGEQKISKKSGKSYRAYYSGFGLRTGDYSDGLLAIDVDGTQAEDLLQLVSGGDLPLTVSWTSNKPGRRQALYQIPEQYREQLKKFTRKPIKEWGDFKSDCDLDFRYNGVQSALPPSRHPDTGSYQWINSPGSVPVAIAPDWLCELAVRLANQEQLDSEAKQKATQQKERERQQRREQRRLDGFIGSDNLEDLLEESLRRLSIEDIYNWSGHNFKNKGGELAGCCPQHTSSSGTSFVVNSAGEWYCFGCAVGGGATQYRHFVKGGKGKPTGKDFVEIVKELANDAGVQFPEQFEQRTNNQNEITREQWLSKHKNKTLSDWIKQQFNRTAWKFGRRTGELPSSPQPSPKHTPRDDSHIIYYQAGTRLEAWKKAREQGYKHILDTSETGGGKSHTAGEINPEDFGVSRAIYLTNDPRNVTTPTLKEWDLLEARHDGLVIDPNNGQIRRRKNWKDNRELLTPANCGRPQTIAALRELNISGADTSEKICKTCPHFDGCRAGVIQFNYLKRRAEVLGGASNIIAHPNSLHPIDSGFPYAVSNDGDKQDLGTLLIVDEAEETIKITKELSANSKDIKDVQGTLIDAQSWPVNDGIEYNFDSLYPILSKLSRITSGEIKAPSYYGWNHHDLIECLGQFPEGVDLEAIRDLLNEDNLINQFLDPYESEHGVSLEDLPRGVKRSLTEHDSELAEKVAKSIKQQWLIAFLEIWQGSRIGYLSINHGVLNISIPDKKLIEIINQSECTMLLSATLTRERLAMMLGCEPDDIAELKQIEAEGAELEIIQIPDLGRLTKQRGNRQTDAVAAIVSQLRSQEPNTKIINFKKFCGSPDDMAWWRDSRGSNAAKDCKQLIINGTPTKNLTALAGEFTALYGRPPLPGTEKVTRFIQTVDGENIEVTSDESRDLEFREFVRVDTLNAFTQSIGRLRANRRPGENLKIYILSNFALDIPVQISRAVDIAVSAGSPLEQLSHFVKNTGLTGLRDVAAAMGKAASTISQLVKRKLGISWDEFITKLCCSHLLLEPINSKSEQPPPLDQLEAESFTAAAFELVEADDLIPELIDLVKVWGWDSWQRIVKQLPPAVKTRFIEQLAQLLPDVLRESITTG